MREINDKNTIYSQMHNGNIAFMMSVFYLLIPFLLHICIFVLSEFVIQTKGASSIESVF